MDNLKKAASGYDYLPKRAQQEPQKSKQGRVKVRVEVIEKVHPQQLLRRRKTIANCIMVMVAFAFLITVVGRYAIISSLNLSNTTLKSEITGLKNKIENLQVDIATSADIQYIQNKAQTDLKMWFPKNSQMRYITVPEPPEPTPTPEPEKSFLEQLWDGIVGLFE